MAIALVETNYGVSATGPSVTLTNTTGANLIVIAMEYKKGTDATPTDTVGGSASGNTWNAGTSYTETSSNSAVRIYWTTPVGGGTGATHVFNSTADLSGMCVIAVSGARTATSPIDQQNGSTGGTSSNPQGPGSITPSVDGCLVVTGFYQATTGSAPTIPSGYITMGTWPTATAFLGGAAYQIQTTATATNPGWTPGNIGSTYATNIASFMPPVATSTLHSLSLLGVGA